jgi:ketosteroid isomerase-like protein
MKLSRLETGLRVVIAFNEAFNRRDVAGMMALVSDDCILEHNRPAPDGTVYSGKATVTQFWQNLIRDTPDARREIEQIFGLGIRCVMRWKCEWVNASEKKEHRRGVDIFELRNGMICEQRSYVKG